MSIIKHAVSVALVLTISFPAVCGENVVQIEAELVRQRKEIEKWSAYNEKNDEHKLAESNAAFEAALLRKATNRATLTHAFETLGKSIDICTSSDGKFRVYSWDTESGGTMHFYRRVFQYQSADGSVHSKADDLGEGDAGSFIHDIHMMTTATGTLYVVCGTSVGSTKINAQHLTLYRVGTTGLESPKLIKTRSGPTHSISFGYDFFSVVDRPERPIRLIKFDEKSNILKFPVVIETSEFPDGKVTDRFIRYQFDGTQFVKVK